MRGLSPVVVVVTTRRADLHAELLATLGVEVLAPSPGAGPSVVAYRAVGRDDRTRLLAWPTPIGLGQPLPTPPLWLASDLAVPLDLEASYRAACADLRIPHPG